MRFKKIDGFPNHIITSEGRVYSINTNKYLKTQVSNAGYELAHLYYKNKRKCLTIHRLVALAFVFNPLGNPVVNHINGIKTDNRADNLEWCTYSGNMKHSFTIGNHEERRQKARDRMVNIGKKYAKVNGERLIELSKKTSKPVIMCALDGTEIKEYESIREASRQTNIHNIDKVLKGELVTSGGYKWKLKNKV